MTQPRNFKIWKMAANKNKVSKANITYNTNRDNDPIEAKLKAKMQPWTTVSTRLGLVSTV